MKLGPNHTVQLSKGTWHHRKVGKKKALDDNCKVWTSRVHPCAPNFAERVQDETKKLKHKDKLPTSKLPKRIRGRFRSIHAHAEGIGLELSWNGYVADTRTRTNTKSITSTRSRSYLFVAVQVLHKISAVLSVGNLCYELGHTCEWVSSHGWPNKGEIYSCKTTNVVPNVVPGLSSSSSTTPSQESSAPTSTSWKPTSQRSWRSRTRKLVRGIPQGILQWLWTGDETGIRATIQQDLWWSDFDVQCACVGKIFLTSQVGSLDSSELRIETGFPQISCRFTEFEWPCASSSRKWLEEFTNNLEDTEMYCTCTHFSWLRFGTL